MNWYDRAELYDILFGWDPSKERDFILGASERWGIAAPSRFLEPFCGSGRLLRAMPGFAVGFDINRNMVRYASRRCRVFLADASEFALRPGCFDVALCLIDSFRHLLTEEAACNHLRAVTAALRPGGVYVLGFDLAGDASGDEWSMQRDGRCVRGQVRNLGDADAHTRIETVRVRLDVDGERFESLQPMRTYTARQVDGLIGRVPDLELAASFDRSYRLDRPEPLELVRGSVVLVLRRRPVQRW